MAITSLPNDAPGAALLAAITASGDAVTAAGANVREAAVQAKEKANRELALVQHLLGSGRLVAADILSTMS